MNHTLSDVATLRTRAREQTARGAVTNDYRADRERVIELLQTALATELVCVLRYKRHGFTASGPGAQPAAAEFFEHAAEEQRHADQLARRIVQLGGAPDFAPDGLSARSHAEYVECSSVPEMVRENLVAERIAVESYREMIAWIGDQDPTTRRMLEEILASEEEHADDLAGLAEETPQ